MVKHTPIPWKIIGPVNPKPGQIDDRLIATEDKQHVAECFQYRNHQNCASDGIAIANADFIVLTANFHERLVKSLAIMSYFAGARTTELPRATNDAFEDIARIFQRETGYLAPGKDCKRHSYDERCKIWNDWLQKKNCEAYQLLAEIESEGK